MWFKRKKREEAMQDKIKEREKKILAIHKDTLETIEGTTDTLRKLNKLLDDPTYKIFLATGGDKRK